MHIKYFSWVRDQIGVESENITLNKEITSVNELLIYELPDDLIGKVLEGKYRGQKQKWFIMKFSGQNNEINVNTENPEFLDWKWIELDQITAFVVDFKLHVYKILKEKVKKIIN